ncbi:hypothetical protein [Rhodoflexus caldus]|uniref:hypothetical protein n=1 Tax=Rhodoflexus caldus TaxID=2891236 RepID=UPI00202A7808|nr:hypothetical protein [Rhodoflexus caldus]
MGIEEIFGYICFVGFGIFYGLKTDDVPFGKALLIGLAGNLMAITVFGCILTPIWLIMMPFGIEVGVPDFGRALLGFCAAEMTAFVVFYWITRLLRPVLRKTA